MCVLGGGGGGGRGAEIWGTAVLPLGRELETSPSAEAKTEDDPKMRKDPEARLSEKAGPFSPSGGEGLSQALLMCADSAPARTSELPGD